MALKKNYNSIEGDVESGSGKVRVPRYDAAGLRRIARHAARVAAPYHLCARGRLDRIARPCERDGDSLYSAGAFSSSAKNYFDQRDSETEPQTRFA